jgi:heptosyltransferase-1
MQVLLIKLSSLGDIIHTLPALTDAQAHYPNLQFDWVVEEHFAEVPAWHSAVRRVIPVALRRWRHHPWRYTAEWRNFRQQLRAESYTYVLDAQGLLKSAFLAIQSRGLRCGLDRASCREPLAAWAYQRRFAVPWLQHAVQRVRQLFAHVLEYPAPTTPPDYGIATHFKVARATHPTLIFLHGTTWETKHWPVSHWQALARMAVDAGYHVRLPWGNTKEYERAENIALADSQIKLIPRTDLSGMAVELLQAKVVIGVDTGLAHLAAALHVPSITLYGATRPDWTGTYGPNQTHLQAKFVCAPCLNKHCHYHGKSDVFPACYKDLSVERVWLAVQMAMFQ